MARRSFSAEPHAPKYRQVLETLSRDILSGKYRPGQKFPSEAALVQQFRTSRITVGRAMRELVQRGLVERIAGSGTYVREVHPAADGLVFGLLIPDLGRTEIFEPICRGIAAAPLASRHALLWGHADAERVPAEEQALQLCEQYVRKRVAGVFFAPLEYGARVRETNLAIVARLEVARIPIVLLDRCAARYPGRVAHDLVGIDNRRAGYMAAEHLLHGVRDAFDSSGKLKQTPGLALVANAGGAPTVQARIAGFREALLANGIPLERGPVWQLEAITEETVRPMLGSHQRGYGFVCVNDRIAGELMRVLLAMGRHIPDDVRIVGIDDVEYASLLPVPLTTVHQPCREIGEAAMAAMLDRIARPNGFVRDILVQCRLVVRDSCGAALIPHAKQ
jgi:DNA-binding LacI/PurR family transcriptional regulator